MWSVLYWLFGLKPLESDLAAKAAAAPVKPDDEYFENPEEIIVEDDSDWLEPPDTMTDSDLWDRYWKDQIEHGVESWVHIFSDDGLLVDAMRASGLRTILCIGNGLSFEPHALARAGFEVTALDLSPFAIEALRAKAPSRDILRRIVDDRPPAHGGRIAFAVGDLRDAACCPGPYDVIIERRTLQLYAEGERASAMTAVANRLADRGIFVSHSHDGCWIPPDPPKNPTEAWFIAEGWTIWSGEPTIRGRLAGPLTTTG